MQQIALDATGNTCHRTFKEMLRSTGFDPFKSAVNLSNKTFFRSQLKLLNKKKFKKQTLNKDVLCFYRKAQLKAHFGSSKQNKDQLKLRGKS